jgi:Histidine kinase-, DNA gyrase B-, and HSP90-like ATPase
MRLRQILLNLLSNACKFTKAGEVKLAARRVSNASSFVEFAVSDTGIGMTAEQQAKLTLRRHRARACHHPQACAHDGRRRDRDERAGQGFGLYGALAGRRGHLEFVNLARHRVPSHSAPALAASERLSASVRFRAVTGCPSRQLPRLGCANNGHRRWLARSPRRLGRAPAISRNGEVSATIMEFPAGFLHCGLMPADLITLAHLSVCSAMNFPNSADVNDIG